ncbi:Alkaline_phosphatase [Hexamita inflata]|uniref:Alkaline phosphatase n=1 Tax=Hexamita inflata TaxID=28002 RepID=A0AA86R469_9EUKA|nr:Alkaline phosphatase [Hexamita inflata]
MFYGIQNYAFFNVNKLFGLILVFVLRWISKRVAAKSTISAHRKHKIEFYEIFLSFALIILLTVDLVFFMLQFNNIDYGPIQIINGNQTQLHWYTKQRTPSVVQIENETYNDQSLQNYHNVLVNSSNFKFSVNNRLQQPNIQNSLPQVIKKFIVMTDVHLNNEYMISMDQNYDFNLMVGDYSFGGLPHEFAKCFSNIHHKPLLLAVGNHDELGYISSIIQRPTNYYQQVGQLGFFVINVLQTGNIYSSQFVSKQRVDEALTFIKENLHIADTAEHIFIASHHAVYSTGFYGSSEYFASKMEQFLDQNSNSRIRAVFSGHDHVFASFKRNGVFFFVNGAGSTAQDMTVSGKREWSTNILNGPLERKSKNDWGYENHLKSFLRVTRTEVNIIQNGLRFDVRDLESQEIVATFDQIVS